MPLPCRHLNRLGRLAPKLLAICLVHNMQVSARGNYAVERVMGGLNQPVYVTQAPGDLGGLFVVERTDPGAELGRIRRYDFATGQFADFLDVTGTVVDDGGLISMTFHPDYQTNGLLYVLTAPDTDPGSGINRLDEYRVVGRGGTPTFQRRILEYPALNHVWHTINQAHFRPNGNNNEMFVLTGDGGTQANEGSFDAALIENPDSIYGKILKIDLTADFSTPANAANHPGIDVVALGIRNPFRSSFDRDTGDFYFGDVGFTAREELDFIPASHFTTPAAPPLNFGWPQREGTIQTPHPPGGPSQPGDIEPIFAYPHGTLPPPAVSGFAVIGGYVYRGPVTELQGRYFFAEHILGNVYSGLFDPNTDPSQYNGANLTDIVNHTVDFENRIGGGANIQLVTSFGEDHEGNLYMVKIGSSSCPTCPLGSGEVFRIVPNRIEATVDRDTGVITITNITSESIEFSSLEITSAFGAINPAALTSITDLYDADGNGEIDDNDNWTVTSAAGDHSQFREQSTGDPGALAPGQPITFSMPGGWIPSPTEDLRLTLQLEGGMLTSTTFEFTGNNGMPYARSDIDTDGALDADDWFLLVANHLTDLSTMSLAEAFSHGDLNGDLENDFDDFSLFKADYIAAHGPAAFEALLRGVPEPSALLLAVLALGLFTLLRGRLPAR
jgi:glucose/arabinose dehydrogenase